MGDILNNEYLPFIMYAVGSLLFLAGSILTMLQKAA